MANLDQLKAKYAPALQVIQQQGVKVNNLHVEGDKLVIRGVAPSETAKGHVWTAFKQVDASASDLMADITVDSSMPQPAAGNGGGQTYTVKSGDSLSKISKQFYGDANKYMQIFEANRDQLNDPDKIRPGQVLKIPNA